jgi:hypothetical protein
MHARSTTAHRVSEGQGDGDGVVTLKMVLFTPMPTARQTIVSAAKAGCAARLRRA